MQQHFAHFATYAAQGDGNPYAPKDDLVTHRPTVDLPRGRLARLGVADTTVGLYQQWWASLDGDGDRREAMRDLALLSDGQLAAQAADVAALPDAQAAWIEAWARKQPNRRMASRIALAVENGRDQPRAGLIKKLGTIR